MKRLKEILKDDKVGKYFFVLVWACVVIKMSIHSIFYDLYNYNYLDWGVSDWLINYEGGFVRRGILGQILLELYRIHPYNVRLFIFLAVIFTSLGLLAIACHMFNKKGWSYAILPFGCCFYYEFACLFGRKDMLLLILTYFIFLSYKKYFTSRSAASLLCFVLLSALILLIHEASFFFTIPILMAYTVAKTYQQSSPPHCYATFKRFLPFVPAFLTMALVCLFKGDGQLPKTIWQSWHSVFQAYPDSNFSLSYIYNNIGNSVNALSWRTVETMEYHLNKIGFANHPTNDYCYLAVSIVLWVWMMLGYYYMVTRLNTVHFRKRPMAQHTEEELSNTVLLQFVFMLPMFTVLSCDFGRTIPYWIFSSLMAVYFFGKLNSRPLDQLTHGLQRPFSHPLLHSKLAYGLMVLTIPLIDCFSPAECYQVQIIKSIIHHLIG